MAQRVFRHYFAVVSSAIEGRIECLAHEFYSRQLIGLELVNDVSTTVGLSLAQRSSRLMCGIANMIGSASNEKPFMTFCQVIKSYENLEFLASKMTKRFGKCIVW